MIASPSVNARVLHMAPPMTSCARGVRKTTVAGLLPLCATHARAHTLGAMTHDATAAGIDRSFQLTVFERVFWLWTPHYLDIVRSGQKGV